MSGILFTAPTRFTNTDGMPQVPTVITPVIPGAMADWSTDQLPTGITTSWVDMTGARALVAPSPEQAPAVIGNGKERYAAFDGVDDRVNANLPLDQPITVVCVARLPEQIAGKFIFTGFGGVSFNLGANSQGTGWLFSNGSTGTFNGTPDNDWHIFIMSLNGANSVLSVDGVEKTANVGTGPADRISIGSSASAYFRTDLRRLAFIPGALEANDRAAIYTSLRDYYNI